LAGQKQVHLSPACPGGPIVRFANRSPRRVFDVLRNYRSAPCERRHSSDMSRVVSAKDDCSVQESSNLISRPKPLRWLLVLGLLCLFLGGAAHAQNLDQGKSGPRLFADSCATCHRSARGLAKGRFRVTLFMFLKDHYSTSSGTAWELASYLESADVPHRGRSRAAAANRPSPATVTAGPAIRPPLPVPSR